MVYCDDNQSQVVELLGISWYILCIQFVNFGLIKSCCCLFVLLWVFVNVVGVDCELCIGYQCFGSFGILKVCQSLEIVFVSFGVNVLWSEFFVGLQFFYVFVCNEIDFGIIGEVLLVFVQVSNSELMYVVWELLVLCSVVMVVLQESDICQFSDLCGKCIVFNKGLNVYWLLLQIFEDVGLGLNDVWVVYILLKYLLIVSDYLVVDVWMMWDLLFSDVEYIGELWVVVSGEGWVNNYQFYFL